MVEMGISDDALAIFLQSLCILWSSAIFCCTSQLYYLVLFIV